MTKPAPRQKNSTDLRRQLPSVSALLETAEIKALLKEFSRVEVLDAIRDGLERLRQNPESAKSKSTDDAVLSEIQNNLRRESIQRLRRVVNATGVILHTGLGRAVLPREAVDALAMNLGCCNMQVDMETGLRGKRCATTEKLLCKLTGAEAALVTNNNAGATLLILAALCRGREVVVSRGQLIEIGGSYRLPDCIRESGSTLIEVGTTNKTHLSDYETALSEKTGAIMHVNPSNYRVVGFTKSVPVKELVGLKQNRDIFVVDDLGCGALVNLEDFGLPHEPTVQESVADGADVVCFSGDKLIGGPQSGIIVGKAALIQRIKKHPLARMLRVCKLTDAALENTLRLFLEPKTLLERHPVLKMIATPAEDVRLRAEAIVERAAKDAKHLKLRVAPGESSTGGGSLPGIPIPTFGIAVSSSRHSPDRLCQMLREQEPPVIARIEKDEMFLDARTLLPGEEKIIEDALAKIL